MLTRRSATIAGLPSYQRHKMRPGIPQAADSSRMTHARPNTGLRRTALAPALLRSRPPDHLYPVAPRTGFTITRGPSRSAGECASEPTFRRLRQGWLSGMNFLITHHLEPRGRTHMPPIGRGEDSRAACSTWPGTDDQPQVITDR